MAGKKRNWASFSLKTLLIMTFATSLGLGWIAQQKERAKLRAEAIAAIREKGGTVRYKVDALAGNKKASDWYLQLEKLGRKHLGSALFDEVKEVNLFGKQIDDFDLLYLEPLSEVQVLHLGMNRLTDDSLNVLPPLKDLRMLTLQVTHITDKGLPALAKYKTLEHLILPSKQDNITLDGIEELSASLPNCRIEQ